MKQLIAADILLRRLLHKLTFDIGEPKDPYCFLIEPQKLQYFLLDLDEIHIYIYIYTNKSISLQLGAMILHLGVTMLCLH